jgi:HEAT repeat protein
MDLDSMRAVLPELMSAGNPPARTEGVQIAAKLGADGERWVLGAACDHNGMVRATARFVLKGRGVTDFAAFYRRELDTAGAKAEGALLGLGDVGRAEDAEAVEPFLADARPRARAAAVEALDRLRRDAAVPAILPLLADDSPRVSRAAREALARRAVPPPALAAIFTGAHPPHARANALRLLARGSRWEAIPWIVRGAADGDPRVADLGRRALDRLGAVFNRSFQTPAPDQLARLAAELDAAGERIDPAIAKWLRDVIRSYGG